uniref:Uncharacterized protein n=1 Tax=Avena sativa TaxID=4498 RepID=A0ACD5X152_AVESA
MDCFHHCIPVDSGRSGSSTPAPEPKDDDGMMSTKLYLALCGATNKDAVAIENAMDLLPPDDQLADRVSVERNNVFHLAAEQGHTELIRKLHARLGNVLSGSLLSSPNTAKDTPLHCAARAGHDVAVTVLVKLARDCGEEKTVLWWKNEAGDTALHLAARLGHAKAVQAMVSKAPGLASVLNGAGVSPLYLAVMSKEERAVEAITSSCRDALAAGPNSQNALHAAVFQGKGQYYFDPWTPEFASRLFVNP